MLYLLFPWVLFHLENFTATLLEEHRNACMEHGAELGAPPAAVLILTAAMAIGSLVCEGW